MEKLNHDELGGKNWNEEYQIFIICDGNVFLSFFSIEKVKELSYLKNKHLRQAKVGAQHENMSGVPRPFSLVGPVQR